MEGQLFKRIKDILTRRLMALKGFFFPFSACMEKHETVRGRKDDLINESVL